jgi:hypothetical protein
MPIKKFRDVSEMTDTWLEPGSPELARATHNVWDLAKRVCPLQFPPGVYKHRSIEEAQALRAEWERANVAAQQRRGVLGDGFKLTKL